jgi:hypothetical protein
MSVVIPLIGPPLHRTSFAQIAAELGLMKPDRTGGHENVRLMIPAQRRPVIDPMRAER